MSEKKSGFWVIEKNALGQSDSEIFWTLVYQKQFEVWSHFFLHGVNYLWKLQVDCLVFVGCGQACLDK